MKLSMMSYSVARQGDFSLSKLFGMMHELDLQYLDMVTLYHDTATEVRRRADAEGIRIAAYTDFAGLDADTDTERQKGIDQVKRQVETAVILGAPVLMLPPISRPGIIASVARRNWIEGLARSVDFATAAGVTLTVESFPVAESPFIGRSDFSELLSAVPDMKITFDDGNVWSGDDPVQFVKAFADAIVHVHFKNWEQCDLHDPAVRKFRDGRHCRPGLIGKGLLDERPVIAALRQIGYQGCINIEYEGEIPIASVMQWAVDYLRPLL